MRIALSGAQCTGKTTLMNKILQTPELFGDFHLIPEVVRSIKAKEGESFEFNKSGDVRSQELILTTHHRNVQQFEKLVTDRCALDAFAYATYNYWDGKFTFKEWALFEQIFIRTIKHYNVIFYLPIGMIPLKEDGVRNTDAEFQEAIDKIFKWVIKQYNLEIVILNDPLEQRFDVLKGMLFPDKCCKDETCTH